MKGTQQLADRCSLWEAAGNMLKRYYCVGSTHWQDRNASCSNEVALFIQLCFLWDQYTDRIAMFHAVTEVAVFTLLYFLWDQIHWQD